MLTHSIYHNHKVPRETCFTQCSLRNFPPDTHVQWWPKAKVPSQLTSCCLGWFLKDALVIHNHPQIPTLESLRCCGIFGSVHLRQCKKCEMSSREGGGKLLFKNITQISNLFGWWILKTLELKAFWFFLGGDDWWWNRNSCDWWWYTSPEPTVTEGKIHANPLLLKKCDNQKTWWLQITNSSRIHCYMTWNLVFLDCTDPSLWKEQFNICDPWSIHYCWWFRNPKQPIGIYRTL